MGGNLILCTWCYKKKKKLELATQKLKIVLRIQRLINKTENMEGRTIHTLRGHLFDTLDGLKKGDISLETAAQVVDVSKTIIDTVRVENEYIALTKGAGSGFIPAGELTE